MNLSEYIRDIPDFPVTGILFKDITPLLKSPAAFGSAIHMMSGYYDTDGLDVIVGIEARGFLFASALAYMMKKPLVPLRKEGKLPFEKHTVSFSLEYADDVLQIHKDAIPSGSRVLIVDDLLATGGTMNAATQLVRKSGGIVLGLIVLVELTSLQGRTKLRDYNVSSLIKY